MWSLISFTHDSGVGVWRSVRIGTGTEDIHHFHQRLSLWMRVTTPAPQNLLPLFSGRAFGWQYMLFGLSIITWFRGIFLFWEQSWSLFWRSCLSKILHTLAGICFRLMSLGILHVSVTLFCTEGHLMCWYTVFPLSLLNHYWSFMQLSLHFMKEDVDGAPSRHRRQTWKRTHSHPMPRLRMHGACNTMKFNQWFGGTCRLHFQGRR